MIEQPATNERSGGVQLVLLFLAITLLAVLGHKGAVLLFVVALLFSIGLHEFGHFITAKRFGIKVEQYFIGFGPKLWSFRRGETEYGVKALPLGGFVRIAGMNPFEEIAPEDRDRVFKAKPAWQRAIVLAAGSFTHFLLGFLIVALTLSIAGEENLQKPLTRIGSISPTLDDQPSPAKRAGLRAGDTLIAIDGKAVSGWDQAVAIIHDLGGKTAIVRVERDGAPLDLTVHVADHRPDKKKTGFIGLGPSYRVDHPGLVASFGRAGRAIGTGIVESLKAIKSLFSPSSINRLFKQIAGTQKREVTDPGTIVGLAGQAGSLAGAGNYRDFLYLIASFNIFIGLANLLPLPPLDGGHLAVLTYEKVRRRDVDMRRLIPLTAAVISAFGFLFVMLLYLDIVRPLPPIPG